MVRRKILHLALSVLLAATARSALAAVGSDIQPAERELIVKHAYRNLTRYAAVGGESITFRISGLRTIDADEFDRARWLRLMTMPGGDMIDMTREVRDHQGRTEAVIYRPKWNLGKSSYLESEEGRSLRSMSVAEVLRALAADKPEAARVTAISSYEVTVNFQGRSRTYRAAVLWLPASPGKNATLFFLDHITQGLEEAVREQPFRPRPRAPLPIDKTLACYARNQQSSFSNALNGYDGHWDTDTSHYAVAGGSFQCNCAEDCSATCEPSFQYQACGDDATFTVDSCHKMATAVKVASASAGDGSTAPPGCAAGLGCVKRSCLYCACGLAVEVEITGTTVTFASSGDPDWQGNLEFSHTCAPCQRVPDDPGGGGGDIPPIYEQDPGSGGGGGGGGGSGCCWWRTTCYTDSHGVYQCTIAGCGQWGC